MLKQTETNQEQEDLKRARVLSEYVLFKKEEENMWLLARTADKQAVQAGRYQDCLDWLADEDPAEYEGLLTENGTVEYLWKRQ